MTSYQYDWRIIDLKHFNKDTDLNIVMSRLFEMHRYRNNTKEMMRSNEILISNPFDRRNQMINIPTRFYAFIKYFVVAIILTR